MRRHAMSKSEDPLDDSMNVVKTATCDTLTKKSKLTYQIGTLPDGEVYVRIHKNSGNGFFSQQWVSLADIWETLSKVPTGKPVTAIVLGDLFSGKSVNMPGFLLAALVREQLLVPIEGKKRSHESVDPAEFQAKVDGLVTAKGKPKAASRKKAARSTSAAKKKARIKQQSAASRKKASRSVRGS
jgi:hypothetical protein